MRARAHQEEIPSPVFVDVLEHGDGRPHNGKHLGNSQGAFRAWRNRSVCSKVHGVDSDDSVLGHIPDCIEHAGAGVVAVTWGATAHSANQRYCNLCYLSVEVNSCQFPLRMMQTCTSVCQCQYTGGRVCVGEGGLGQMPTCLSGWALLNDRMTWVEDILTSNRRCSISAISLASKSLMLWTFEAL